MCGLFRYVLIPGSVSLWVPKVSDAQLPRVRIGEVKICDMEVGILGRLSGSVIFGNLDSSFKETYATLVARDI